jgi:Gas vesicle synthesis protein GvpL/GvpF
MSCYLYAVAPQAEDTLVTELRGVAGSAVDAVREGDLVALVSEVPDREFNESALRSRLEDLEWLESVARAHHGVVDALASHDRVLPLRLATVYHDRERVHEVLRDQREEFTAILDRVGDRSEWGVKIYTPRHTPQERSPQEHAPDPGDGAGREPRSGRDYLQQRLRGRREREDGRRRAVELSRQADAELREIADAARLHPPQDPRLSGVEGENVLNAAYLVDHDRAEEFAAHAWHLAERGKGVRLRLTGPWAPYSFTTEPPSAAPAPGGSTAVGDTAAPGAEAATPAGWTEDSGPGAAAREPR